MQASGGHKALVIGTGSIGGRHAANLKRLGVNAVALWDPDAARAKSLAAELGARAVPTLADGLADGPSLALVCSPPAFHVTQAREALGAGCHVFIEKPVSATLDGLGQLESAAATARRVVQVGYNLRYIPALREIKRRIDAGGIGRVFWLRAEFGQYLPDWRPSQDYRTSYTARRELGGGIVLDATHEIDYALWFLGRPLRILALGGRLGDLEMNAEDCATLLLQLPGGAHAEIHLDCLQRAYSRGCKVAGTQGTLEWSFGGPLRWFDANGARWSELDLPFDISRTYEDELRDFLGCIAEGRAPESTLESARATLEVALEARAILERAASGPEGRN